jgi:hypothetical protein
MLRFITFSLAILLLLCTNHTSVSALCIFAQLDEHSFLSSTSSLQNQPSTSKSQPLKRPSEKATSVDTFKSPKLIDSSEDKWLYFILPITVPFYIVFWSTPVWVVQSLLPWLKSMLIGTWSDPGLLLGALLIINTIIIDARIFIGNQFIRIRNEVYGALNKCWLHVVFPVINMLDAALSYFGKTMIWISKYFVVRTIRVVLTLYRGTKEVVRWIDKTAIEPISRSIVRIAHFLWNYAIIPSAELVRCLFDEMKRWLVLIVQQTSQYVLTPATKAAASAARLLYSTVLVPAAELAYHAAEMLYSALVNTTLWTKRHVLVPAITGIVRTTNKALDMAAFAAESAEAACRATYTHAMVPAARSAVCFATAAGKVVLVVHRCTLVPAAARVDTLLHTVHRALVLPAARATERAVAWVWYMCFGPYSGWMTRGLATARSVGTQIVSAVWAVLGPPVRAALRAALLVWRGVRSILGALGRVVSSAVNVIHGRILAPVFRGGAKLCRLLVIVTSQTVVRAAAAAAAVLREIAAAVHLVVIAPAARAWTGTIRAVQGVLVRAEHRVQGIVAAVTTAARKVAELAQRCTLTASRSVAAAAVKTGAAVRRIKLIFMPVHRLDVIVQLQVIQFRLETLSL